MNKKTYSYTLRPAFDKALIKIAKETGENQNRFNVSKSEALEIALLDSKIIRKHVKIEDLRSQNE